MRKRVWIWGLLAALLLGSCQAGQPAGFSSNGEESQTASAPVSAPAAPSQTSQQQTSCIMRIDGEDYTLFAGQEEMEKPLTLPKGHSAKAEIIFNEDVDPIQVGFKEETGAYTAVAGQKTDAYTHVFSLPGAEGTYQVNIATSYPQPVMKFVAKFQLVVGSGQYQPLPKVPAGLLAMENVEDYSRFYTYLVRDDLPYAFELEIAQLKEFGNMRLVLKEQITDPQPLPITHPFTVWAQYNGQQESLYVSEGGIVYEDTLYYPSNLAALEAFLQSDQDGVTYRDYVYFNTLLDFSADEVEKITYEVYPGIGTEWKPEFSQVYQTQQEIEPYLEQLGRLPVYIWQPGDERIDRSGGYIFIWTIGLKNGQQYEILSANRAEYLLLPSGEKIEFLFALTRERDRIFAVDETK